MSQQGFTTAGGIVSGNAVQWLQTSTAAFFTINTTMDGTGDAIPQITDGTQLLALSITPTKATNRLFFDFVCCNACREAGGTVVASVALFQDATVNALAAAFLNSTPVSNAALRISTPFSHSMLAGTTSSTTFQIRCGVLAGTEDLWINGATGRQYGGVSSTTFRIIEVEV